MNPLGFLGDDAVFDHVGLAVVSIRATAGPDAEIIDDPSQRVSVSFVDLAGLRVELIQPLHQRSPIDRSLKSGQCLVHLCFRVANLEAAIIRGRRFGLHQLARPVPAVAFGGRRIVWLFSKTIGLVELLEDLPAVAEVP